MIRFLTILFLLLPLSASATTYYIDFTAGSDSNNGTSKATPWKRHPYMKNWGGTYSHSPGDKFIFKGGVTWPASSCLTMVIKGSGTVANPDEYTVDPSWYDGASFTKPKFDAQGAEFNGGFCVMILIEAINPQHDIIFDNIDFTGLYWNAVIRPQGWVAYIAIGASTNIKIRNCNLRNWSHAPYSGSGQVEDQMFCVLGYNQPPYTAGCEITDCLFDGETLANQSSTASSCQAAVFGWGGKFLRNVIRNTAGGIFTSGAAAGTLAEVGFCTIGPMGTSYNTSVAHTDGIQDNGGNGVLFHDNYLFDVAPVPAFFGAGWGGGTYYIWNNVIDARNHTAQTPITFDAQAGGNTFYIYNNTIIAGPNVAIFRANWRPSGGNTITKIDTRNNHFIGEGSVLVIDSGVTVGQFIQQNNFKHTYAQANTAGYQRANWYKPTTSVSPTVGFGQDLSSFRSGVLLKDIIGITRPQLITWDAGAYEFTGGSGPQPPNTPTNVSPASGATGVSLTPTLTGSAYGDPQGSFMSDSEWSIKLNGSQIWNSGSAGVVTAKPISPGILTYSTTYSWTVRYKNQLGLWSAWSTETSFTTTAPSPPATPSITSPSSGSTGVSLTPTITASSYSDPQSSAQNDSEWTIKQGASTVWTANKGAVTSTAVPAGILGYGTTYTVTVRYKNDLNVWSAASSPSSFTTEALQPPATPSNSAPANGATGVSRGPTLSASAYSHPQGSAMAASEWIVLQGGVQAWGSGVVSSTATSITIPADTLAYSTVYTFKVRYRAANGLWSSFSAETSFATVNPQAPLAPSNVSPANGATSVSLTPSLIASAYSDPQGSAHSDSEFVVYASDGVTVVWAGLAGAPVVSKAVPAGVLSYATTYKFSVRYKNALSVWSAYSVQTSFTTLALILPPATPTNVSPANAATGVSITTVLIGSAYSDPQGSAHNKSQFQIYLGPAVYWDSGEVAATTSINSPTLAYSTFYGWRVRYKNAGGEWSAWSSLTGFTTIAQPELPIPTNATIIINFGGKATLGGKVTSQ